MALKILIVDDHPIFRAGLSASVNGQAGWSVCAEAGSGEEALKQCTLHKPDIMITDFSLPDITGADLTRDALIQIPKLLVIIVSVFEDLSYVERALRAGARGYVTKSSVLPCLLSAIKLASQKRTYLSPEVEDKVIARFSGKDIMSSDPVALLSDREAQVFALLGEGQTKGSIAQTLNRSPSTIETYRANIKRKLNLASGRELFKVASRWVEDREK